MREKLMMRSCKLRLVCGFTSMLDALRMADRVMCCTLSILLASKGRESRLWTRVSKEDGFQQMMVLVF